MKRQKRDPADINPRFSKPDASRKINFTKRTLNRLFQSWRYGLLDEAHLNKLLTSYPRITHRELELSKSRPHLSPRSSNPTKSCMYQY